MSVPSRLIWVLLASVLAVNVYRAATQSITVDEAFTHEHFVAPPFYKVMTSYDPNHHVLNSLLAKVSTGLFGVSELTLRIPSLAGGLIYLLAVRAIVLYAFSAEWAIAAFALLSLNPFITDYLIAARGYGLALGFLMAALWFFFNSAWYRGGICLGLALAANLTFLVPVIALGGMVALFGTGRKLFGRFLERVLVPAAVIPFVAYVVPLSHTNPTQFYWGAKSMIDAMDSFVFISFMRNPPPFAVEVAHVVELLGLVTLVASAVAAIMLTRRETRTPLEQLLVLTGGAMGVCLGMTWLMFVAAGVNYPFTRTGVYWPAMLTLAGVALADRFLRGRALRWPALLLSAVCVSLFLRGFEVDYFQEWQFDAGAKRVAALILKQGGRGKVRIACSGLLIHSLRFYGERNGALWDINPDPKADADFHVLMTDDFWPGMRVRYRDPVSEVVVLE